MAQKKSDVSGMPDYQAMKIELDEILSSLQDDASDVDAAMAQYKRGLELVQEMEAYLKSAENSVKKLKSQLQGTE